MGLKAGLQILQQTGKNALKYTDNAISLGVHNKIPIDTKSLRLASEPICDSLKISKSIPKIKLKHFNPEEILDMKPSTFKKILFERDDIPESIKSGILSPEKLNLYDELMELKVIQNMPKDKLDSALSQLFGKYNFKNSEASAQLEIIPELLKKGFDLDAIAELPITHANKNQVEYLLNRTDLYEKWWNKKASTIIESAKARKLTENSIELELDFAKKNFDKQAIAETLQCVTDKNIKYLDECINLTGNPSFLPYWTDDMSRIISDFCEDPVSIYSMDRLFRREHNYDSVKYILGEDKLTDFSARLLEFKNFDKLKDIGIDDLSKLSTQERKEFLNGFISAATIKELKWMKADKLKNLEYLQRKMKIYQELNISSNEACIESYKKIVDKFLDSIPLEERKVIDSIVDTKAYRRDYRLKNPIPSLADELDDILKPEIKEIKGRKIKYAEINDAPDFAITTHGIPSAEAIKTIEALEITDPNMLLCVGAKGCGKPINFYQGDYAIAVKPRKASDWHIQANGDIDSGNNASKNIYNFENRLLPMMGNHRDALDLVPNEIKKILDLSQRQYSARMLKIKDCKTLQEIEKIDSELAKAIRKVIKENPLGEGLIRPEPMGVLVKNRKTSDIDDVILDYCVNRNITLVGVKPKSV